MLSFCGRVLEAPLGPGKDEGSRGGGDGKAGDTTRECFGQAPAEHANIKQMF